MVGQLWICCHEDYFFFFFSCFFFIISLPYFIPCIAKHIFALSGLPLKRHGRESAISYLCVCFSVTWIQRYSQLLPCGHLILTCISIIRTAAKSRAKINYRHWTEINSCYYELDLPNETQARSLLTVSVIKGVDCIWEMSKVLMVKTGHLILRDGAILHNWPQIASDHTIWGKSHNL